MAAYVCVKLMQRREHATSPGRPARGDAETVVWLGKEEEEAEEKDEVEGEVQLRVGHRQVDFTSLTFTSR